MAYIHYQNEEHLFAALKQKTMWLNLADGSLGYFFINKVYLDDKKERFEIIFNFFVLIYFYWGLTVRQIILSCMWKNSFLIV